MTSAGREPPTLRVRLGAELAGRRADEAVLRSFDGFSRKEVRALFEAGRVRLAGRRVKKGERVEAGAELVVEAEAEPIRPDPTLALSVQFESADFVIVDKPAGLPTAPLVRSHNRSLAAALLARYPEMAGVGFREREPGLVHRLDNQTSGVVLAARHQTAFEHARALLEASAIDKRYLAIVDAALSGSGEIETQIGPDPADPRRVRVFEQSPEGYAKLCRTTYRVLERGSRFALVELTAPRAFRHQVRVHLAHLGFPIAGDRVYSGPEAPELGARHALHGSVIAWAGEATRAGFRGEAPLPAEMRALLDGAAGAG